MFQAHALVHEFAQLDNTEQISDTFFAAIVARQSILIFEGFVCVLLIFAGSVWILWVRRIEESGAVERREMPGFALWLARTVRKSPIAVSMQRLFAGQLAPFFFALALLFAVVVGLNRFAFAIVDAGAWACLQSDPSNEPLKSVTRAEGGVSFLVTTNKGCQSSHLRLIEGATYFMKISDAKDWKMSSLDPKRIAMGPPGFWTPLLKAPRMIFWIPFRRYWTLPWFSPIVRVGSSEVALKQSGTFLKIEKSSELYFFVNDVVIGWPSLWEFFYRGNKGDAKIIVRLIDDPPPAD